MFFPAAVGFVLGALIAWLVFRAAHQALQEKAASKDREIAALQAQTSVLEALRVEMQRAQIAEAEAHARLEQLTAAREQLPIAFRALSQDVLRANSEQFLQLAQETLSRFHNGAAHDLAARQSAIQNVVQPLSDSLQSFTVRLQEMEQQRTGAYSSLTEQVRQIAATHEDLRRETGKLSGALRSTGTRGRWGEIQLRRVVEMAGMVECCDFDEQPVTNGAESPLRPDLLIRLPNERRIVVDAKAPMQAYLDALDCTDEKARNDKLAEHARQIRRHLKKLGEKTYWAQFESSPEFVIAFLPGEIFFSAALQQDPELIEFGVQNRVMVATPTTLIALLKAVAYGWNQDKLARNAQEIRKLGSEMYDRIKKFAEHYEDLGKAIENAQNAYERGRRSMDSRLLSTARKLEDLGAASGSGGLPAALNFGETEPEQMREMSNGR
jgi:DNA recombination protein RmuC